MKKLLPFLLCLILPAPSPAQTNPIQNLVIQDNTGTAISGLTLANGTSPVTALAQGSAGLMAALASGTASSSTFLRGDGTWVTVSGTGTVTTSGSPVANGFAYFTGSSVIASTAAAINGQLLIGSTGTAPVAATLTAGSNITITNAAGSITIASSGGGGGSPGGSDTDIQFNSSGSFAGDSKLTRSDTTGAVTIAPSGATGLTINADNGTSAAIFNGNSTTSGSFGMSINAGTNSSDFALNVSNFAGTHALFVDGTAEVMIGTATNTSAGILQIASNSSSTKGISFGNDSPIVSFYRSGVSTLTATGRWVFTPTTGLSGLNVGQFGGNPSTLVNGDVWYNSSAGALNARIAGATVSLGSGGGGSGTVTSVTFTGDGVVDSATPSTAVTTSGTVLATIISQSANTILGNNTGSGANPAFHTVSSYLDNAFGSAQGDILYRDASGWQALIHGISGQFLETLGASANPQWQTLAGGGNVSSSGTINPGDTAEWDTTSTIISVGQTGTGNYVKASSPTLISPTLGNATATTVNHLTLTQNPVGFTIIGGSSTAETVTFQTGMILNCLNDAQTFSLPPNGDTLVGLNNVQDFSAYQSFQSDGTHGSIGLDGTASDPSAPNNGDLWYNSSSNELKAQINGAAVNLGAGGGGGSPGGSSTDVQRNSGGSFFGDGTITADNTSGVMTLAPAARSSGVLPYFKVTAAADTGITTATESKGLDFEGGTRTWADGTVAKQEDVFFGATVHDKTTTSATFTDAYTVSIGGPPTGGSGVTITRPHSLGIMDTTSASSSIAGALVVGTGTAATSVGIGGGNVNIGGTTSASTPLTGSLIIGNGTTTTSIGMGGGNMFVGGTTTATGSNAGAFVVGNPGSAGTCVAIGNGIVIAGNEFNAAGGAVLSAFNLTIGSTNAGSSQGVIVMDSQASGAAPKITFNQTGSNSSQIILNGSGLSIDTNGSTTPTATFASTGVSIAGNVTTTVIGNTLAIKSGSNSKAGTFTLVAGVATVANTSITANSVIVPTLKTVGGTITGALYYPTITAGTGFTVAEVGGVTDTSTYNYIVLEVN